jgi:predicted DNA-binding transcriptional regulator YafY
MSNELRPVEESSAAAADEQRVGGLATSAIVRTQRALQILRLLQAGQVWSAAELAVQFDCSTRTIFRDIQLLRDCGIPIDSPTGDRGFKLQHDFFWQPERPTLEEMIALVLGTRMAEKAMPKDMARNLDSAMAKLVGSEKPAVRERLTELKMRIDAPHLTPQAVLPEQDFLPLLLDHIVAHRYLRMRVAGENPDAPSQEREAIPVRLQFVGDQWLLTIAAWEGAGEETLPLARIEQIESPPASVSTGGEPKPGQAASQHDAEGPEIAQRLDANK